MSRKRSSIESSIRPRWSDATSRAIEGFRSKVRRGRSLGPYGAGLICRTPGRLNELRRHRRALESDRRTVGGYREPREGALLTRCAAVRRGVIFGHDRDSAALDLEPEFIRR